MARLGVVKVGIGGGGAAEDSDLISTAGYDVCAFWGLGALLLSPLHENHPSAYGINRPQLRNEHQIKDRKSDVFSWPGELGYYHPLYNNDP